MKRKRRRKNRKKLTNYSYKCKKKEKSRERRKLRNVLDKKQKTRLDGRTKVNWRGSRRSSRNSRTMPKISDTSSNRISRKRFHLSKIWRRSTMNSAELPGLIYGSGSSILDGLSMLCLQGFLSQFSLGLLVHGILS
jgi:hypothetical protein